ncbi:MAG TPA: hypothetical protein VMR95_04395 [Candidatus Binatia bacterium]|nr:hypothetical protein [Candidatus Binatia bacterium]
MDDINRGSVQRNTVSESSASSDVEEPIKQNKNVHTEHDHHDHHGSSSNFVVIVLLALILLILVGAGSAYLYNNHKQQDQPVNTTATEASQVNTSEYQAVFLSNGQIYFGKLVNITPTYIKLTDIYYLESQAAQGSSTTSSTTSGSSSGSSKVVLIKLGNEIHGPEDAMQIYRDQVMFWENLKPSGDVTQAIDKYQQ